jgi:protein-disulfide isomerase
VGTLVTGVLLLPLGLGACTERPEIRQDRASLARIEGVAETVNLFAGIPQDGIVLGNPQAPVTLTEFIDLQCSHCATFSLDVLPVIVRDYVRKGKVKLEFRNLAFVTEDSVKAARMAAAVGLQDQLWQYTHLFLLNHRRTNSGRVTDAFLQSLAQALPNVDAVRAMKQRNDPAVNQQLEEANALADRFGIEGTPSFLLRRTGETPRVLEASSLKPEEFTRAIDPLLIPR